MKALYPLAALAALAAGSAHAACSYPKAPDNIPDGNNATLDQMVAAQKAVKQFDEEIGAYTACLKLESDSALAQLAQSQDDPKKKDEQKKELERVQIQKHNAAVEEDEALAQRFNEQLKVFKAKAANAKK